MKEKLLWVGIVSINLVLFLFSMYLAWGWVTVADIKAKCERDNVDFDEVMQSLISTGPDTVKTVNAPDQR